MIESEWKKLHTRFLKLLDRVGASKNSFYGMMVVFDMSGNVLVELNGYDIPNWPSSVSIGPCITEEEALILTERKIAEAEKNVEQDELEYEEYMVDPCPECGSEKDPWFSRTIEEDGAMHYYCQDCGARRD